MLESYPLENSLINTEQKSQCSANTELHLTSTEQTGLKTKQNPTWLHQHGLKQRENCVLIASAVLSDLPVCCGRYPVNCLSLQEKIHTS